MTKYHTLWLLLLCLVGLGIAPVRAAPTYAIDSSGNVVRDGHGECVQVLYGNDFPECRGEMMAPMQQSDSDGDGVPDAEDRCAGTPRGSAVDSRGCVIISDSDGDGIPDTQDRCPGTPKGSSVNNLGCVPIADSDGDGIPDTSDLCANTPRGARVNASGCVDRLVVQNLVFATNTAELQPQSRAQLDGIVSKIKGNQAIRSMTITGYTDDRGAAYYNQYLSEQRAQAVRSYFIEKGIDGNMIRADGKGEADPVATNATAEGRAQNRRVEIDFQMR